MPCSLQSAIAGPNARVEALHLWGWLKQATLKAGSWAISLCKPRQVRKEAAVSKVADVPRGSLARVTCSGTAHGWMSRAGHGHLFEKPRKVDAVFLLFWYNETQGGKKRAISGALPQTSAVGI